MCSRSERAWAPARRDVTSRGIARHSSVKGFGSGRSRPWEAVREKCPRLPIDRGNASVKNSRTSARVATFSDAVSERRAGRHDISIAHAPGAHSTPHALEVMTAAAHGMRACATVSRGGRAPTRGRGRAGRAARATARASSASSSSEVVSTRRATTRVATSRRAALGGLFLAAAGCSSASPPGRAFAATMPDSEPTGLDARGRLRRCPATFNCVSTSSTAARLNSSPRRGPRRPRR